MDLLAEISPRSKTLRRWLKVPLVLTQCEGAIQVGVDQIFFKFGQILLISGLFSTHWLQITILFILGIVFALSNLHFINLGVKYYDATDCIPVLNAALLIAELTCGLVLGGEVVLYTTHRLFWIFVNSLICIAGIQVLVMKTSQMTFDSGATGENATIQ